jgi:hypothetical protein
MVGYDLVNTKKEKRNLTQLELERVFVFCVQGVFVFVDERKRSSQKGSK